MSALAVPPARVASPRRCEPDTFEVRWVAGYRIEAVLGRGRHGDVYLARRPQDSRRVALKVARRAPFGRMGVESDLARQFAVMSALSHRHVVQAFDQGVCGGDAYLAMEYADGGSMASRQAGATVQGNRIAPVLADAAGALACLHERGWVHRDVKPANLLLRADASLALGDFGCACRSGEAGAMPPGLVVGTPRYAAPEQSQGAPAMPAADVYSLGVCLYEMLTGQVLYPGETLTELLCQHLLAPIPRLSPQHAAWQPLLDAMLAKDPSLRLADGQAVLHYSQRMRHSLGGLQGRASSYESRNLL